MGKIVFMGMHERPAQRRTSAHAGMLEFISVREGIQSQTRELSSFYGPRPAPKPRDIDLRIARICFATYLLETLETMLHIADRRSSLLPSFETARKAVREILPDHFFTLTGHQVTRNFLEHEEPLRSSAARFGIDLLMPEPAVERYQPKLASEINRMYGL
ncbi:MAG: hypothetical protein U0R44_03380 [Candidatus Micrarchaeia archaeon]